MPAEASEMNLIRPVSSESWKELRLAEQLVGHRLAPAEGGEDANVKIGVGIVARARLTSLRSTCFRAVEVLEFVAVVPDVFRTTRVNTESLQCFP